MLNLHKESDNQEMSEYDEIFKENIRKQVKIVNKFQEKMKIREKMKNKWNKLGLSWAKLNTKLAS